MKFNYQSATECALACAGGGGGGAGPLPAWLTYAETGTAPQEWTVTVTATDPSHVGVDQGPFDIMVGFANWPNKPECKGGDFDVTIQGEIFSPPPPPNPCATVPVVDLKWTLADHDAVD